MDTVAQLNEALAGRYEVLREIGAGGMATVFLANDVRHGRQVAIKVLRPDLAASLGAERFLREIRIAAQLQHPHILPVFDSGEAGSLLWYAMPFVAGETLRSRLSRDGALPVHDTLLALREVADALAKAHKAGVVHRDIKPENILLADGHALVADFGVAKALSDAGAPRGGLTTAGMSLGTPGYMAPEQVAADPAADHRVDIYSLGVVGYELLAGVAPFAHLPPAQQLAAHVTTVPEPIAARRADAPPALAAAITRALAKLPGERPQTAEEFRSLLDSISGAQLRDTSTIAAVTASSPASRRGVRLVAGAAVAAVLIAATLYLARSGGSAPGAAGGTSLAVLPLENLQGDSAATYFSDGISEEILGAVSRLPGLRVAGRSVSFRHRGRDVDVKQIGRDLGVSHVLEGSVRNAANRVRVNVRLTDTRTGFSVWSEKYDRELTDIFAVEDQIAQEIARALDVQLASGRAPAPTGKANVEAHDQYLLGLASRNARDLRKAAKHFGNAIAADSTYAAAYAGLASVLILLPEYGLTTRTDSALATSRAAAHRALALDSTQATAHIALAYGDKMYERNFARADDEYRRALALDPNMAEAHHWHGELLMELGRFADARDEFRQSLAQDRTSPATQAMMAALLFRLASSGARAGLDSAAVYCRQMTDASPPGGIFPLEFACGTSGARHGLFAMARPHLVRAGAATGDSTFFVKLMDGVSAPAGHGDAIARIDRALAAGTGALEPLLAAVWYVALRDDARAISALETAERGHSPYLSYLEVLDFSPLAGNERYKALRKRLGYAR